MKKHIVLVNTWRVVNAKGGTEKVFCDMANALISMGYSVTAICLDKNQGAPGFNISSKVRFINAYQGGVPLTSRSLFKNLRSLAWDRAVRHKKRSEIDFAWKIANINSVVSRLDHVDLYVSFQPVTTHFLAKCKDVHAPIITMLHGVPSSFKTDPIFEYYRDSVEKASALTVLMPDFVQSAREMFRAVPIAVIPNAICQFERSADLNERKVVCVARMSREKRVELMLKAFSIIKDSYDEWVIEFWGEVDYDPEYRDEVFELCDKLGLNDRVSFPGTTSNVEKVLSEASVFAFPSLFEGFPLSLGEAMSKGLAVVGCQDCPGVNSLLKNGRNGLLVDPTPEAFSRALSCLMESADIRRKLGAQARIDVSAYCPDKVWEKWKYFIESVINNQK